jgi:Bacterial protein of unknown function (DUF910).
VMTVKSILDVRDLLKRFGTIIYIGDRQAELELMEQEVRELYRHRLISEQEFLSAILIISGELRKERENKKMGDTYGKKMDFCH